MVFQNAITSLNPRLTVDHQIAGRVAETGPTRDVLKRPIHPYTSGLMESGPGLHVSGARLKAIRGSPPSLSRIPPGCVFHPRCDRAQERCRLETPPLAPAGTGRSAACHFSEAIRCG
jgi:oligopeptide transport system ATP-binding protein